MTSAGVNIWFNDNVKASSALLAYKRIVSKMRIMRFFSSHQEKVLQNLNYIDKNEDGSILRKLFQ